ncbi:MAG: ABC transporter ATP-binding protein, partial [Mesorhizobium sp.]
MSANMEPCLEIRSLSAVLPNGQRVLRSVSLTVQPGEVRALVGESGAGKTMIGKALLGVLPKSVRIVEGEMLIEGEDLGRLDAKARRTLIGARTALIPQDPLTALNPSRRIGPQMTDRLVRILGWSGEKADKRIRQLLHEVQIREPERVLKCYPHELSGGMRQRVGLARALATDADVLIMDEAFSALDPLIRTEMQDELLRLQHTLKKTILFITHDFQEALKLGTRIAIMSEGELVREGTPQSIVLEPGSDYVAAFTREVDRSRLFDARSVMRTGSTVSGDGSARIVGDAEHP